MKDIKVLREERGLSQNQLAKNSGLAQSFISYIEKHYPHVNLSLYAITQLAKGLNISVRNLMSDD